MSQSWISKEVDMKIAAQIMKEFSAMPATTVPFITLSREYGCDGWEISRALEKRLSLAMSKPWRLFHRDMLEEVDEDHKVTDEHLDLLEEFGHSDLQSYFLEAVFGMPSQVSTIHNLAKLYQILAKKGSIIFLGGGAGILTKDLRTGLNIRIFADQEWRVQRHAQRHNIRVEEARKRVTSRHKRREAFIKTFLGENFRDVSHYHLLINNAKMDPADAVELITQYLRVKYPGK